MNKLLVSMLLILGLVGARVAVAEQTDSTSPTYDLKAQALLDLQNVQKKFVDLANAVPAAKFGWKPAADTRSFAEVLMHVAGEWYFYTPRSVGATPPADFGAPRETLPKLEKITAKQQVLDELRKSWAHCKSQVGAVDPAQLTGSYKPWGVPLDYAAFSMDGDLHEHLGQLIAYARSVGVKPPWSK